MPQEQWSRKRERQYQHIKSGLRERGYDEDQAEEIASRTVNKERAQVGESDQRSRASTEDISPGRGGKRSGRSGPRTYQATAVRRSQAKGHRGPFQNE